MDNLTEAVRRAEEAISRLYSPLARQGEAVSRAESAMDRLFGIAEPLLESVKRPTLPLEQAEVAGTYRVVLVRPGWSENGRYYSQRVLAQALALFEGAKAYADHPSQQELRDRPERSVRDIIGYYGNVKQEPDGRLTATLHLVETAGWLRPLIEAGLVGLSINALGHTRLGEAEGRRGQLVESIAKVTSVDVVTQAAAGGGFAA